MTLGIYKNIFNNQFKYTKFFKQQKKTNFKTKILFRNKWKFIWFKLFSRINTKFPKNDLKIKFNVLKIKKVY